MTDKSVPLTKRTLFQQGLKPCGTLECCGTGEPVPLSKTTTEILTRGRNDDPGSVHLHGEPLAQGLADDFAVVILGQAAGIENPDSARRLVSGEILPAPIEQIRFADP